MSCQGAFCIAFLESTWHAACLIRKHLRVEPSVPSLTEYQMLESMTLPTRFIICTRLTLLVDSVFYFPMIECVLRIHFSLFELQKSEFKSKVFVPDPGRCPSEVAHQPHVETTKETVR